MQVWTVFMSSHMVQTCAPIVHLAVNNGTPIINGVILQYVKSMSQSFFGLNKPALTQLTIDQMQNHQSPSAAHKSILDNEFPDQLLKYLPAQCPLAVCTSRMSRAIATSNQTLFVSGSHDVGSCHMIFVTSDAPHTLTSAQLSELSLPMAHSFAAP